MDCRINFKGQNRKRRRRRAPDTLPEPADSITRCTRTTAEATAARLRPSSGEKYLNHHNRQLHHYHRLHLQCQQPLAVQQYDLTRCLAVNKANQEREDNDDMDGQERLVRNSLKQETARLSEAMGKKGADKMSWRLAKAALLSALVCCCFLSHLVTCQSFGPEPLQFSASSQAPQSLNSVVNGEYNPEARAENPNMKPNALEQLVGFLNSYANSQAIAQNRRPPLPINGQRLPQQQQQSQQTSTPLNPFAAGAPFQSNRRGSNFVGNSLQQPNPNPNNNNNQLFQPSSPATPFLTLNRIPQSGSPQGSRSSQANFNIQPLNTIPLGSISNQNRMQSNNRLVPPIRLPQSPSSNANQPQVNPFRPPPIAPALVQSQAVRPSGGFAPSGPPPSQGANNALVVVQSPNSPQGQASAPPQQASPAAQDQNKTAISESKPTSDAPEERPRTGSEATTQADRVAQPTDTSPAYSVSPSSEPTTATSSELDKGSEPVSASSWNPVEGNRTEPPTRTRISLAPSPDIVTVPPGYNPDSTPPQNYDIAVSAQMGQPVAKPQQPLDPPSTRPLTGQPELSTSHYDTPTSSVSLGSSPSQVEPTQTLSGAPTAVTTIFWSPPPSEVPVTTPSSSQVQVPPSRSLDARASVAQTAVASSQPPPSRIRDNSMLNDDPTPDPGVVYGKPQTRDSKPVALPPALPGPTPVQANIETSLAGRPFIQPVQMDNQVRPYPAGGPSVLKSNHGQTPFRSSRPIGSNGQTPMHVGSGFTISGSGNQTMPTGDIQDYVANQPPVLPSLGASGGFHLGDNLNHEPTISAQGAQDPATLDLSNQENGKSQESSNGTESSSQAPPRLRRPTFKPKPAIPPIRIDSCIVGDDSSCDQSHNERCVTEYGISSCHCKPGYARLSQLRGYCGPVSSLQLSIKIDKLSDDRRLVFNQTLDNSNSEEYQYLEFETIQALAGAFQQAGSLAKQFMGARVNKFFERKGKVWANVSVNFEANNMTKTERVQTVAAQELARVVAQTKQQKTLGDSTIMLDGSKEAISRLVDVNECASRDLNDCSKHAVCTNDFGGFHCQCLTGYEDKYQAEDRAKHGRVCLGCSPSYCSNRGECHISDGVKHCKCRPNFIGARCDIDSEVLAVAVGGSLVGIIILVITFWCLFVFNRRWKREQQKMDAMSATSGLTFNYVNSSTNSLMSPSSRAMQVGGLHRSGGHQVGAMAANYGQRFSSALAGGARNGQHYAADQQAIIGSTSSNSSAASQPIGCNPYTAGYQYEDAGLLIAPASTGSSEQTSPTSNSYRGFLPGHNATMMPGTAYTLSGHHHHHHHHPQLHHHHQHQHQNPGKSHNGQLSQFHPAAATEYRTLNPSLHCPSNSTNHYDTRWRTFQQDNSNKQQSALVGYYLSPEMLVNQQQLYASPRRELCIDTGDAGNNNKSRKQKGRASEAGFQSMRSRSQAQLNGPRGAMYHSNDYEHER